MPNDSPLSSSSEHASDKSNKPSLDTPTPSMVWTVPENQKWELHNEDDPVMTAKTTDGNDGPAGANADPTPGTTFGLAYREKDAPMNQWTVFAYFPVDPFNVLSQVEQLDGKGEENRTVVFDDRVVSDENGDPVDSLTFEADEEIALVTNGDDSIDAKELYFNYARTVYSA
jgi:hypothetical protein